MLALGPTYESTATLVVTATRSREISSDAEAMPTLDRVSDEDLNAQVELLRSDAMMRRVLAPRLAARGRDARLDRPALGAPREAVALVYRTLHGVPPPTRLDEWADDVGDHLDVRLLEEDQPDPRCLPPARRRSGVGGRLRQRPRRRGARSAEGSRTAARGGALLRAAARSARRPLARRGRGAPGFFAREGLESSPEQRGLWQQRLTELTFTQQTAEIDRAAAKARVAALEKEIGKQPEVISKEVRREQNQAIQFLKPRILEKEIQRSEMLSLYAPDSSFVRDVERELAEARRLLDKEKHVVAAATTTVNPVHQTLAVDLAQNRVEAVALAARARSVQAQVESARERLAHLDRVAAEHERLEQDVTAAREALATYTRKQERARLASALDASRIVNVEVVRRAETRPTGARAPPLLLVTRRAPQPRARPHCRGGARSARSDHSRRPRRRGRQRPAGARQIAV